MICNCSFFIFFSAAYKWIRLIWKMLLKEFLKMTRTSVVVDDIRLRANNVKTNL